MSAGHGNSGDRRVPGTPLRSRGVQVQVGAAASIAAALLLVLGAGAGLAAQAEGRAAEVEGEQAVTDSAGPVSPDSADALRAAMVQPPARPGRDVYDVLALPLRVATLPLAAVAYGVKGLLALTFRPDRPPNPVLAALRDLDAWGLEVEPATIGPRSGPGGRLELDRFHPFFAEGAVSFRGSQRYRGGVRLGEPARDGWLRLAGEYRRWAEPHFWGIGSETGEDGVTDFRWDQVGVRLRGGAGAAPLFAEGWLGFEHNEVGRGFDADVPDLQDVVDADTLFGLGEETGFVRLGGALALDLMSRHRLQPRGFRARLAAGAFLGVGDTDADFIRWEGQATGYLPLNERQQLVLRGLVELNRPERGRGVPFTHLASLGGHRGPRGFDHGRFRDRDMFVVLTEWRYEIWRSIREDLRTEGLVFFDIGTVAPSLSDLDGSDPDGSYGFGMRTVSSEGVAFLWYVAISEEETQFRVKLSWPY